ncbi:DUF2854 domain-containing protein [Oscillatoriales cyanobacterium LEGE 11467]|uniref:DUF2854 domain-containing protein n=1 Tax=Zarconia navalis LEGE 11467 TaxID=1828826 RepID=A0A928W0J0_9CYAN|nr:DUF2854 domain-containing protein [Zarconia navalis]MBE9041060.1 DUF2854 domain-containing protein [Zarconia navalis LEGE 11467]
MLRQISLGKLGIRLGLVITVIGFGAYFADYATLNLAGFFYGIPLILIGLALKSGELKPVPLIQPTSPEVLALRERQATSTQTQIREDITRYRYGQDAHLEEALSYLGLGLSEQERPIIEGIREESIEGCYALILVFESPLVAFETWQEKTEKMEKFFGPNVRVEVCQPEEGLVEVAIVFADAAPEEEKA